MEGALLDAAFCAAMAFMLLFGLLQFVLVRERLYALYSAAVGTSMLWKLEVSGIAARLPWPELPESNEFVAATLGAATAAAALLFTRELLGSRTISPTLDRLLVILVIVALPWTLGAALAPPALALPANYALAITAGGLSLAAGATALRRGKAIARFHVVGVVALLAAVLAAAFAIGHPQLAASQTAFRFIDAAIVLNALVFAAAMADRTRRLRLERDELAARSLAAVLERRETRRRLHAARTAHVEAQLLAEQSAERLRTASHDLRSPLAGLRVALASMVEERRLPPDAALRLGASLDYLDDLAAQYLAEAGPGTAHHVHEPGPASGAVPVAVILENIDSMFRELAERKGLEFRCRRSSRLMCGNATALTRMLGNIVANAIAYTSRGGIVAGCRRRGQALRLLVYDTGPGLTPDELERVMEAGERGTAAIGTAGSGLGLAIVSELAAAGGYVVEAKSTPGRGSCFGIVVPTDLPGRR